VTGPVLPVDADLSGGSVDLDDDVDAAAEGLDAAIAAHTAETDPTYVALTALVDRIRDDDRLHRVEQVMRLTPW
jgi:hypothetical protein